MSQLDVRMWLIIQIHKLLSWGKNVHNTAVSSCGYTCTLPTTQNVLHYPTIHNLYDIVKQLQSFTMYHTNEPPAVVAGTAEEAVAVLSSQEKNNYRYAHLLPGFVLILKCFNTLQQEFTLNFQLTVSSLMPTYLFILT